MPSLKLRVRPNITSAQLGEDSSEVVYSSAFKPVNALLMLELVEDHPTFIHTATLDPELSHAEREALFHQALVDTAKEHPPKISQIGAKVDGESLTLLLLEGEAPWVSVYGMLLAAGWCPLDEYAGQAMRVGFPRKSAVAFVPQAWVDEDERFADRLDALTREMFETADPRDALLPQTFSTGAGELVPTTDAEASQHVWDRTATALTARQSIDHESVRRMLVHIVMLAAAEDQTELAAALAELACHSYTADMEFSGPVFMPGVAELLDRHLEVFPPSARTPLSGYVEALRQGEAEALAAAQLELARHLQDHYSPYSQLASVEESLRRLSPWFAAHFSKVQSLEGLDESEVRSLAHRIGWTAWAQLREHLPEEVRRTLTAHGSQGIRESGDRWFPDLPLIVANGRSKLESIDPALRLAYERLAQATCLLHFAIIGGSEADSLVMPLCDFIAAWQWVRGVLATDPLTTPTSKAEDAQRSVSELLEPWNERGRDKWLSEWLRLSARWSEQLDEVFEPDEGSDPSPQQLASHIQACREVLERLRDDAPPEATDALAVYEAAFRKIEGEESSESTEARFLDGSTPADLDGPDGTPILEMVLALTALTCRGTMRDAQTQGLCRFFEDPPTKTLREALYDREVVESLPEVLPGAVGRFFEEPAMGLPTIAITVERGHAELLRAPSEDYEGSMDVLRELVRQLAQGARGWMGLGTSPSKRSQAGLDDALNLLEIVEQTAKDDAHG